ncbi:MAG: hypothetical protein B7Z55_08230 [Planctomycetales bacterium 12-60-4]|nr:MAG: hypothetical protein B7Z55_08230 [Planctomycetales bacterium 12-60-4]
MESSFACQQFCRVRPTCHCLGVHGDEIRDAIADGQLSTVRQVTQSCGAGGGCTACHRHIKRFLAEAAAERAAEAAMPAYGFA